MQLWRQTMLLDQIAIGHVDIDEGWFHVGDVEFFSPAIGMGPDAAIGDDHGAAVGEQRDVVRLHAMRVELRDLLITASGVTNANHTPRVVVVIFRCVENLSVGRENAMTGEMPVGPRLKPSGLAIVEWHRDAELAGMARECDPLAT